MQFGIAAIPGSGEQIISWIHIDDLVRMFIYAIEQESLSDVFNAVAPLPATNKELSLELARICRGNFFIPIHVPSLLLKCMLGEMSNEVLKSTTVSCRKISDSGFIFQYPTIKAALEHLK